MSTEDALLPTAPVVEGPPPRMLLVRAAYYREVVDGMTQAAIRILEEAGATHDVLDVAGAFELAQAIRIVLRGRERFDGYIALGCVIRGETDHYTFICDASMKGLMDVALQYGLAMGTGLLTVGTIAQATARSGPGGHNKGAEAAVAALRQVDASGDPAQDYFSDGLSEELINTLTRLKPLHVVGRASSFHFKGSHDDGATIGLKLGVAYLLDGSVRRSGELVRVSAELADAKTGYERWNATYDRDLKDIFAVQSGIAQAVADALKVQLFGGDIAALSLNGTTSPEAYDSYLRGRHLLELGGGETDYRQALARFDAAIAADPRYASAYAARATTLVYLANQFVAPDRLRATYDAALASARQSVELAPGLAATQTTLAATLVYANHDFAGAKLAFAQAKAEGGGDPAVLLGYGLFACELGDCEAGAAALRRATTLDPLNPGAFKTLGSVLIGARRYPDAIAALRKAVALSPRASIVHGWIGDALLLQGDLAGARSEYALEPLAWARRTGQAIVPRAPGRRRRRARRAGRPDRGRR